MGITIKDSLGKEWHPRLDAAATADWMDHCNITFAMFEQNTIPVAAILYGGWYACQTEAQKMDPRMQRADFLQRFGPGEVRVLIQGVMQALFEAMPQPEDIPEEFREGDSPLPDGPQPGATS